MAIVQERARATVMFGLGLLLAGGLTAMMGCHVDAHKDGNDDNVKIATPFGGMTVKTNESVVEGGVGLSVYPGAVIVKKEKEKGHDSGAADVHLNFGSFHLGVKAISYKTPDSPEKVTDYYRNDMAKYGSVILCHGNKAVGMPDRTRDGLSCDRDHNTHLQMDEDNVESQLRAGSKLHQHIVAIDKDGTGTKIGLIALDLPGHMPGGADADDKQ
jgi:hypothetical protein